MTKKPTITLLLFIFAVPLFASYWLYFNQDRDIATTNWGDLIMPPLLFQQLNVYDTQLQPLDINLWHDHWLLVYVLPKVCDQACEYSLYQLGQIHKALGKEQSRVKRMVLELLLEGQKPSNLQPHLPINDYLGSIHSAVEKDDFCRFIAGQPSSVAALDEGAIYLVDPLGNLMMYYVLDAPAKGILKDLERLLKVSQIG